MKEYSLTDQQLARFCSSFSLLLRSGLTCGDGIHLLSQNEEGRLKEMFQGMGEALDAGLPLSDVLQQNGFPEAVSSMIRIGERTGKMEEALQSLASFYDQRCRSRRMIKNAVAYPAMILCLMLVVVGVLLVQVLPVLDGVYASFGSGLTGVAAGLLKLGQLLKNALPALLVLLFVVVAAVLAYGWFPVFRIKVDDFLKSRFGDRGASRKFGNARFARGLSMGLSSGLTPEEAVALSEKLLSDSPKARLRCSHCVRLLGEGASLFDALGAAGFLCAADCRMLAVGLRSGSGDKVMEEIADRLMEEAVQSLEDQISRVEPAMVLLCSGLVGAILLSVMLPLMNIMEAIG